MTTSITIINTIITGQIAYIAAKADTAECREADLKAAHADPDENIQENIKTNHVRKSTTCMRNLNTGQLNISAINDDRHLISFVNLHERYLIES
jgi:hypothetical protein